MILLDINMPQMNGFEVCERLKNNVALRDIPVIFISALNETMDKVKAFGAGGVDYVTKPFQFEEVQARVQTHLHLRRLQLEQEDHNRNLERLVEEKVKEISDSQMATIFALAKLAESRDDDTGKHIERVQTFCKVIAQRAAEKINYADEINEVFIENIYRASPLHDIGKVGITDSILLKPGKLTPEEFEIMKTHTTLGAKTLQFVYEKYPNNAFIKMGIAVAISHHEKWDGSGYPNGLAGNDIPLPGRIMAVADVYDALRSERCYKEAFSHEKSYDILIKGKGQHFDPGLVDVFDEVHEEFKSIRDRMND